MGGRDRRARTRAITYSPLPSQSKFHRSKARFKGFSGPIGSGKSQALCQEAIRLSYVNPGRHGLIGAPTYPMLRDATLVSFMEVLHKNDLPHEYLKSESVVLMKDTGSRILFRAVDDFERLRGTNLAWFGVDELTYTTEDAWLRLEGRLRDPQATELCGFGVWTPKGFDWVYKRFIRDPVAGYEAILAKAYENRYVLEKIPDFYERLKSSYDEHFFEQEVLGAYLNVNAGAVYHVFNREKHVQKLEIDPSLPLLWTLDFNVDPMTSLIAQISHKVVRFIDEIVLSRASTQQACEEFMQRYPNYQSGIQIYGDASGKKMQTSGPNDYQTIRSFLRNAGYTRFREKVPDRNPAVRDRVMLVNQKLLNAAGDVELLVDPRCKELIQDLEEIVYKPESGVIDKERDWKRTHAADAMGYLVWQEFSARAPFGEIRKGPLF